MPRQKQAVLGPQSLRFTNTLGLNNVIQPEKCKPNELQTATNVDITQSRQIVGRQGYSKIYAGTPHSIFSDGVTRLFREGDSLKKLNSDYTASTLRSGLIRSNWMRYLALNDLIYYTDEHVTGIVDTGFSRSWGLPIPTNTLSLSPISGLLPSGRYLCTLTFVSIYGQESGAPNPVYIDLATNNSGILISNIPTSTNTDLIGINLYLSTRNGELMYFIGRVNLGSDPYRYQGNTTEFHLPLDRLSKGPPHAGHIIAFYNGRIYIARDSTVWYTEPYNYELMDLAHGYMQFPGRITLLAPVQGGVWVSAKNHTTMFLAGEDPVKGFTISKESDYPAIEGSQREDEVIVRGEEVHKGWYWTTENGVYMGIDGGELLNKTEGRYAPGSAEVAVSVIKKTRDGSKQYVSVLY